MDICNALHVGEVVEVMNLSHRYAGELLDQLYFDVSVRMRRPGSYFFLNSKKDALVIVERFGDGKAQLHVYSGCKGCIKPAFLRKVLKWIFKNTPHHTFLCFTNLKNKSAIAFLALCGAEGVEDITLDTGEVERMSMFTKSQMLKKLKKPLKVWRND